jgi:hypothetical protein
MVVLIDNNVGLPHKIYQNEQMIVCIYKTFMIYAKEKNIILEEAISKVSISSLIQKPVCNIHI